jgi:ABC-type glycerol-3-phosphate transport system substrate-binding protein
MFAESSLRQRLLAVALSAGLVLAGCGSTSYASAAELIAGENCSSPDRHSTMLGLEIRCDGGTLMTWHADNEERDAYEAFVKSLFNLTPASRGDRYLIFRNIPPGLR